MIQSVVMIYPYYNNPSMLTNQISTWNQYPDDVALRTRVVVVDDHSDFPAAQLLKRCRLTTFCYRLSERHPWNQHECRNIGAREASNDDCWMFMSDMDIELRADQAQKLFRKDLDPARHYTMERVFAASGERKVHCNTFLTRRCAFWRAGGYDIDLNPVGGGGYGGDGEFIGRLSADCPAKHLSDVMLVGYGRASKVGRPAIPDADTIDLDREEWHAKYVQALARKKASGRKLPDRPIRTPYERVL